MLFYAGFEGPTLEAAADAFCDVIHEESLLGEASFKRWEMAMLQFLDARDVEMGVVGSLSLGFGGACGIGLSKTHSWQSSA